MADCNFLQLVALRNWPCFPPPASRKVLTPPVRRRIVTAVLQS